MESRSRAQIAHLVGSTYTAMKPLCMAGSLFFLASIIACVPPYALTNLSATAHIVTTKPQKTTAPIASTASAPITTPLGGTPSIQINKIQTGYTHQRADGNRFVAGSGQFPEISSFDIPLPGVALWIVAIPWNGGSFWVVTLENGQVLGFQVNSQSWQPGEQKHQTLEAGQPPLLYWESEHPTLLIAPSILASPLTHAIPLHNTEISQVFIDIYHNLIRVDTDMRQLSPITANALPDARILSDEQGRLLYLSSPTEIYGHGVLGDAIEAGSISLIDDPLTGAVSAVIEMPDDLVIEGIAPIWADLNGDGEREIIVTASDAKQGAQILVFDEDGKQIAAGPAVGKGYRWRHQIAVANFGPIGELELVDVLTPHLDGVVEFYQWVGDHLKVVAQVSGYTSHVIGTRNLDMAAAGDFDRDGQVELVLPNLTRSELVAIRHKETGAEAVWFLPLDAAITSNLGAVTLLDGSIAIGIGLENGILRIWHP